MLFGYRHVDLGDGQRAFVAEPEKALLDLIHLHPGGDDAAYLRELRLDFDALRLDRLEALAETCATPKLARAAGRMRRLGATFRPAAARVPARTAFPVSLPRYSEDLGFALEGESGGYRLRGWLQTIRGELAAEDYRIEVRVRESRTVHNALVRFPGLLYEIGLSPHRAEVLAIKVEVDTRPPAGATMDTSLVRRHETLRLFHHDRASQLAGKLHAVLQRPCTKGRDRYDLIWYLSDPGWPPPNFPLLNAALRQTEWPGREMTPHTWRRSLAERLDAMNWDRAVTDLRPFLERQEEIDLVNRDDVLRSGCCCLLGVCW